VRCCTTVLNCWTMKDICEGVTRYKFGAIGISNWYRIEQISEHIGEHIGIYTSEYKFGAVYGRILDLVDEAAKHNWCHWFFVAILLWACAQWSRIFALRNWAVWTLRNCSFSFWKVKFLLEFFKALSWKVFSQSHSFNSIRIGTTSLSCFAFKSIDNVPAGRAVFFSVSRVI